ncbi:hypothetical protein M514_06244 [Trichuris suis]|uniref:Uncharacterized protein n=1 Tax=Trichuris suis TaxID=68888 RepID=A0A085M6T8_9BILA|nr:hypothetical protein M513_06244 [Trichuris suis]KFD63752.1 hypothetical protein M514_06244 [Trichuris suis]
MKFPTRLKWQPGKITEALQQLCGERVERTSKMTDKWKDHRLQLTSKLLLSRSKPSGSNYDQRIANGWGLASLSVYNSEWKPWSEKAFSTLRPKTVAP